MEKQLNEIKNIAEQEIKNAVNLKMLDNVRIKFLGKKGELTKVLRGMGSLSKEERPVIGKLANEVRAFIEDKLDTAKVYIGEQELNKKLITERIDVTLPGKTGGTGSLHPLTKIVNEITDVFLGLGYQIAEGPEVEHEFYNFEALNTPQGHPARDEQDTFYINDKILLRTQTSPVQARVMENTKPPVKIICPGRVYRSDEVDATHSPVFHQIEGLAVDKGVTMGDLIGTLKLLAKSIFGDDTDIRLRPHHFPFTEPSAEVDVSCWTCKGKGCRMCKNEGWVEILGAGMVHPNVLSVCKIDPVKYSGFAFGLGIERIAMAKYNISDMRMLYENDIRFLKQF